MPNQVPHFDAQAIGNLAIDLYGIDGDISSLVSFEDQNARIKTPGGSYVLKIANKRWAIAYLHMQSEVLEHLRTAAPDLCVPRIIASISGQTITVVDGFAVRLLTFLEGNTLGAASRSVALYFDLGHFMGRFSSAMRGYTHPSAHRPDDLWNLDNVIACKAYLPLVADEDVRARIARFYRTYEKNCLPKLQYLRKSVIHNDANEQNLLVGIEGSAAITGLIDFGDMVFATLINELAITLAYALLGEDEIETAACNIIRGYQQEFPLVAGEIEVLSDLVAMRLVQSIIMSSKSANEFPDNPYILISQKPARALLKRLDEEDFSLGTKVLDTPD